MTLTQAVHAFGGGNLSEKVRWLSTVDSLAAALVGETFGGYTEQDGDAQLKIPAPYDEAYFYWLEARIHYQNGDFTRFNNASAMFNALWQSYSDFCHRNKSQAVENRFQ